MKPPPVRDRGDDQLPRVQQVAHRYNKAFRQTLHLADLVHQVDIYAPPYGQRRDSHGLNGIEINLVLADAMRAREIDVRHHGFATIEGHETKSVSFSSDPDLLRVEPCHAPPAQLTGKRSNDRRLTDARRPGDEQHVLHGVQK